MAKDESLTEFENELKDYIVILEDRYSNKKIHRCLGEDFIKYMREKNGKQ